MANCYCSITDLGDRKYKITEIYDYPKSKVLDKMKNSLYQYIIPLILSKIIEGHDENHKISLTSSKWARQIHMINGNYSLIKYHKNKACDTFEWYNEDIDDFYNKADDMISMYLQTALKYLTESGVIIWREDYIVHTEKISDKVLEIDNNNIKMDLEIEEHHATNEEMEFYSSCIKKADELSGIKQGNANERYYGKKAKEFNQVLNRELNKRNIKYIYKSYEVYSVHLDWCENLLKEFDLNEDKKTFINRFNDEFQSLIMNNANDRYNKNTINMIHKYSEKYLDTFFDLCDITIKQDNEHDNIRERIGLNENTEEQKYNININILQSKGESNEL